jgi:hypothetical protein
VQREALYQQNMKMYSIQITADRYPTDYTIRATNEGVAAARALRQWRKKFRGSRANQWSVRVIASGILDRPSISEKPALEPAAQLV